MECLRLGGVKAQLIPAALGVELTVKAHNHIAGLAGVGATPGSLFLGEVECPLRPSQLFEFARHIGGLGLDFLHTNTIRLALGVQASSLCWWQIECH